MSEATAAVTRRGTSDGSRRDPVDGGRSGVRTALFAALYLLAMIIGRQTAAEGLNLSLVYPAAGVGVVWMAAPRPHRWVWTDYALLVAITVLVTAFSGAEPGLASFLALSMVVQVAVFRESARRAAPRLWTGGVRLAREYESFWLLSAAVVSSVAAATVGLGAVLLLGGDVTWTAALMVVTRNTVSVLLIAAVGFRLASVLGAMGRDPATRRAARVVLPRSWRILELALAVAASAVAYTLVFSVLDDVPVVFALIPITVWVALRFDTTIATVHSLVVGVASCVLTLEGWGPFARVEDGIVRALLVQVFVGVTTVVGLTLALNRDERDSLLAQVREQADDAAADVIRLAALARASSAVATADDARRAVCAAVLDITDADGAYLMEPDGLGNVVSTAVVGLDMPTLQLALSEPSRTAEVLRSGTSVFMPDISDDERVSPQVRSTLGTRAAACFPVLSAGDAPVVGVLCVTWRRRIEEIPPRVVHMIETLAAEAAHAIERGALLARLEDAAGRDALTGIANRRRWDAAVERVLREAEETRAPLALALIDLDHFKTYNDTYGHPAGDALLREFSERATALVRDVDVLARWGGEEFAVALPGCTVREAVEVLDRLRNAVPAGQTCTVGVAAWAPGMTVTDVMQRADAALYAGKSGGRDRVAVHDAESIPSNAPGPPDE